MRENPDAGKTSSLPGRQGGPAGGGDILAAIDVRSFRCTRSVSERKTRSATERTEAAGSIHGADFTDTEEFVLCQIRAIREIRASTWRTTRHPLRPASPLTGVAPPSSSLKSLYCKQSESCCGAQISCGSFVELFGACKAIPAPRRTGVSLVRFSFFLGCGRSQRCALCVEIFSRSGTHLPYTPHFGALEGSKSATFVAKYHRWPSGSITAQVRSP